MRVLFCFRFEDTKRVLPFSKVHKARREIMMSTSLDKGIVSTALYSPAGSGCSLVELHCDIFLLNLGCCSPSSICLNDLVCEGFRKLVIGMGMGRLIFMTPILAKRFLYFWANTVWAIGDHLGVTTALRGK